LSHGTLSFATTHLGFLPFEAFRSLSFSSVTCAGALYTLIDSLNLGRFSDSVGLKSEQNPYRKAEKSIIFGMDQTLECGD
jgi:hypothetical protein